jgi:hypothetical protein
MDCPGKISLVLGTDDFDDSLKGTREMDGNIGITGLGFQMKWWR